MPTVTTTTTIDAGLDPIWELMCSPARYPEFVEVTERMEDVGAGEFGIGYVYKERGGMKPFTGTSEWVVTEFEPKTHQQHVGDDGKVQIVLDIDLAARGDRTQLTLQVALKPRWFVLPVLGVMWPAMMRKRAQADMDSTIANVKRLVESGS